jgi:hypothetical protein
MLFPNPYIISWERAFLRCFQNPTIFLGKGLFMLFPIALHNFLGKGLYVVSNSLHNFLGKGLICCFQ